MQITTLHVTFFTRVKSCDVSGEGLRLGSCPALLVTTGDMVDKEGFCCFLRLVVIVRVRREGISLSVFCCFEEGPASLDGTVFRFLVEGPASSVLLSVVCFLEEGPGASPVDDISRKIGFSILYRACVEDR